MKKLVINTKDILHNLNVIKSLARGEIIAVLKGDGYGLGVREFGRLLYENGVNSFAVSEIWEAVALQEAGIGGNILLLSCTEDIGIIETIIEYSVTATLGCYGSLAVLNETCARKGATAEAHIKIDTGFGRYGFTPSDAENLYSAVTAAENINITGIYSHLSNAFGKKDKTSGKQYELFSETVARLEQLGLNCGTRHIANSSAALRYPHMRMDAARVGSALLGRILIPNVYGLRKVAYIETAVSHVTKLPARHNISYGNAFKTKKPERLAVIPIGYRDGYGVEIKRDVFRLKDTLRYLYSDLRSLNKKEYISIDGNKRRRTGRVCMCNITAVVPESVAVGSACRIECNPLLISDTVMREWR